MPMPARARMHLCLLSAVFLFSERKGSAGDDPRRGALPEGAEGGTVPAVEADPRPAPRKEVIQPQVPLRLPCYDFTPVADPTVDGCLLTVSAPASG